MKMIKNLLTLVGNMPTNRKLVIGLIVLSFISSQYLAVGTIELYQSYISPNKGWVCAYGKVYPDEPSCSEYGKQQIINRGLLQGVYLLWQRFDDCEVAYRLHKSHSQYIQEKGACEELGECTSGSITGCLRGFCNGFNQ